MINKRDQFLTALNECIPETAKTVFGELLFDGKMHQLQERGEFTHVRYMCNDSHIFILEGKQTIQYRFRNDSDRPEIMKSLNETQADNYNAIDETEKIAYCTSDSRNTLNLLERERTRSLESPAYSTCFYKLNELLDGGFREQLTVIGGSSSVGKTTFMLQLANHYAATGYDVIYFSLEQGQTELLAKSLSCISAQIASEKGIDRRTALSQNEVQDLRKFDKRPKDIRDLYDIARDRFSDYAQHLFFVECEGELTAAQIRQKVKQHYDFTGKYPVVFLDYLQLLTPSKAGMTDKQAVDDSITVLRRIVRDYQIPIFTISSTNRAAYSSNVSNLGIFKESGAIEYSCDVALSLEYSNYEKCLDSVMSTYNTKRAPSQSDINQAFRLCTENDNKGYRDIKITILKNRRGKKDVSTNFTYYSRENIFIEK